MIREGEDTKLRYDLISFEALHQAAMAATYGVGKHGPNNWRKEELTASQTVGAMLRHLQHLLEGNTLVDAESGLPITCHIVWNAMALAEIVTLRPQLNDLKEVCR